jgi:hypothetical protein
MTLRESINREELLTLSLSIFFVFMGIATLAGLPRAWEYVGGWEIIIPRFAAAVFLLAIGIAAGWNSLRGEKTS